MATGRTKRRSSFSTTQVVELLGPVKAISRDEYKTQQIRSGLKNKVSIQTLSLKLHFQCLIAEGLSSSSELRDLGQGWRPVRLARESDTDRETYRGSVRVLLSTYALFCTQSQSVSASLDQPPPPSRTGSP